MTQRLLIVLEVILPLFIIGLIITFFMYSEKLNQFDFGPLNEFIHGILYVINSIKHYIKEL
jgi:energy-coupling factor transporter transmembrane protein EcfT